MSELALTSTTTHQQVIPADYQTSVVPLDQNPAAVYLATLRPSGRRSMHHYLNVIAGLVQPGATAFTLAWGQLRYQHTAAIRSAIIERGYKTATANTMLAALRRVLRECRKLGQMPADDYTTAIDLPPVKGETLLRGRALSHGEIGGLMNACGADNGPAGARDAALVAVAYGAGLRRSELVGLELADYDSETGAVKVRSGKGGKDRLCYLGDGGAGAAMADWLAVRGGTAGPLFVAINKGGRVILGQQMSSQAIFNILKKRGKLAGVGAFSPHDMRRSFISDLLDAGADIATVQKLAGHASVTTTARYDRRGEIAKKKAASLLHVPYTRRRLAVED